MNYQQKRAGQSTRDMAQKRYKNKVRFVLGTAGVVLVILLIAYYSDSLGIGVLGSFGLLILARLIVDITESRIKRMMKEERRAIRGAKAEETIAIVLHNLGADYVVLHDIQSPYGNIDHIVLSKESGIFLIETKAHGGKVSVNAGQLLVNGHKPEKDFIAQALNNTYWLRETVSKVLSVEPWITPVLVFTNAFVERFAPVKGVVVVNKKFLLNILQRPNLKVQNSAIWEQREKIVAAIYDKQISIQTSIK